MSYEYQDYWNKKEPTNFNNDDYRRQIFTLPLVLDELKFDSVLELGVGTGRITKLVLDNYNPPTYHGIDINENRINEVKRKYLQGFFAVCDVRNINPDNIYDLVLAIEFFMHIKPEDIEFLFDQLTRMTKQIVSLDYSPFEKPDNLLKHNFVHDYKKLYEDRGYKVKQKRLASQVIFIATRD